MVREATGLKFQAINESKEVYPVSLMCMALGVTPGGYYNWRKRPESRRSKDNRRVVELIEKIHLGSRKTYGFPRVYSVLSGMGETCSKSRVERLMRENNIKAKTKKKFRVTTDSNHKLPVAENVLARDFSVGPSQTALAGDITYIWTNEGWLYLSVVMQLSTRKIVGWSMAETMDRSLVINSLKMAMRSVYAGSTTLFHSDRGSSICQ